MSNGIPGITPSGVDWALQATFNALAQVPIAMRAIESVVYKRRVKSECFKKKHEVVAVRSSPQNTVEMRFWLCSNCGTHYVPLSQQDYETGFFDVPVNDRNRAEQT